MFQMGSFQRELKSKASESQLRIMLKDFKLKRSIILGETKDPKKNQKLPKKRTELLSYK